MLKKESRVKLSFQLQIFKTGINNPNRVQKLHRQTSGYAKNNQVGVNVIIQTFF